MMGCTINMAPSKQIQSQEEETEKVTASAKEAAQVDVPWPHEMKEYWYARYFATMAMNPDIQKMLLPSQVFEIVKCSVDQYEKDHDWKWFQENLGDNLIITKEASQYVYLVTKKCADITKATPPKKSISI